jgi:hypothetical protein
MSNQDAQPDTSWIARPGPEHRWLEQLVGEWEFVVEAPPDASSDAPAAAGQAPLTQVNRSLEGVWLVGEARMQGPDGSIGTTVITLGYDPARARFVGSWIGSMMTHLWVYDGELDPARRVLSLYAHGPDMSGGGGMAYYCDAFEVVDPDHHVLRASVQDEHGDWKTFMTTHYRRRR